MSAGVRLLCRCQVVFTCLFCLAIILLAVGCGTSSLGSYQSAFSNTSGAKFNMHEWRFEHDLFNSKYHRAEKEDWEDDGPG
jgi:hypothetical protein